MKDENDLFLKKMKGVIPMKKSNKLKNEQPKETNTNIKKKLKITKKIDKKTKPKKIYKTEFVLEKISIKKNIKKKFFKIGKKIDFHGKGLVEAEETFSSEIFDCYNKGYRCLLFVTGKGLFKTKKNDEINKPKLYHGVIREAFFGWVKSKQLSKYILSFTSLVLCPAL